MYIVGVKMLWSACLSSIW